MPIAIHLKRPPVTLVIKGKLGDNTPKKLRQVLGRFMLGKDVRTGAEMLICTDDKCNVGYMTELSDEKLAELLEKQKEQEEKGSGRIVKPNLRFPSGRKH